MLQPESRQEQVRQTFRIELDARVPAFNRALSRLERAGSDPARRDAGLWDLFREAHNLKAAARTVGDADAEQAAQKLEASAADARLPEAMSLSGEWFDAAYALVDILAGLRATSALVPLAATPAPAPPLAPPAPPAPPARVPAQAVRALPGSVRALPESMRVGVDKLDALLTQAGELAVTNLRVRQRHAELHRLRDDLDAARQELRNTRALRQGVRRGGPLNPSFETVLNLLDDAEQRNVDLLQRVDDLTAQLGRDSAQLGLVTRAVEGEVMAVRLLPIATLSTVLERTLRDLIRSTGKEVALIVEGAETEMDRKILEQVRDPLMHLLRNAVDHGVELPDVRVGLGKPRRGTVRLRAGLQGGFVEIEMSDDGAGLDPAQVRVSAVRKNMLTAGQAAVLDDAALMDVIFQPGFSTRTTVTELSGRGVGLDVVRQNLEQLNGRVWVSSQLGAGTRFTLRVPLTLATTRAVVLEEGGQLLAMPSTLIERTARVRADRILTFERRRAVTVDGRPVPVVELAEVLERPSSTPHSADEWRPYVMLQHGERRLALLTDKLLGEQEIVVKSLGWPLEHVPNISGAAVLGSGETVVILNPVDLLNNGTRLATSPRTSAAMTPSEPARRVHRLLAVDDSLTTRTLIRSILEAAGYAVAVAADGLEALTLLRGDALFDLVVADVEMPRMDGFELTEAIRRDERLRQTPVVLVTSLAGSDHRERGVAAGADAYVVKSAFDQNQLLDAVDRLL